MPRLALLAAFMLLLGMVKAESPVEDSLNFRTSAALYLTIPSIKALAEVVIPVLPGMLYVGRNLTIGVHVDLGSFFKLNIYSILGDAPDLSKEETVAKVTSSSSKSVRLGVTGITNKFQLFYDFEFLFGLIKLEGPMNITIKEAGGLLTASFYETKQGYLFNLNLGSTWFGFNQLEIASAKGYKLLDYIIWNFQYLIPYLGNAFMGKAMSAANSALTKILKNTNPEEVHIPLFTNSELRIKPLVSPTLDPKKEMFKFTDVAILVLDKKTGEPYYDRPINSRPKFFEELELVNQLLISDNLLNSLLKAIAIDNPSLLQFNVTDDSVQKMLTEVPELRRAVETDNYLIWYGIAPETEIVATKSLLHITGKIKMRVDAAIDEATEAIPLVTFYPKVSIKMNVTISKYRVFVMVKEIETLNAQQKDIHHKSIMLPQTEEELREAIQETLLEESSILNGNFMLPFDLSKVKLLEQLASNLVNLSVRFDILDNYFILGFNPKKAS